MPTDPPPSRYRVVERGRRLEVIDTHGGSGSSIVPSVPRARSSVPVQRRRDTDSRVRTALLGLARLAALGATDANGLPILTTADWFDSRGPRALVLDEIGQRRLATGLGIALAVMMVGWLIAGPLALVLPVLAAAVVSQHGKYLLARWFDGFTRAP